MRGLKMARGSPLGKGAGTGVRRERRMERTSRFFDILLIVYLSDWVLEEMTQQCIGKST